MINRISCEKKDNNPQYPRIHLECQYGLCIQVLVHVSLHFHVPALCVLCIIILSTVCNDPLGIEDRRIPDSSFFASSEYSSWGVATNARLNRHSGYGGSQTKSGWRPSSTTEDANPYIGVHLGGVKMVSGIVLQGERDNDWWVTQFKVAYKVDADAAWMVVSQEGDMVRLFLFRFTSKVTKIYQSIQK